MKYFALPLACGKQIENGHTDQRTNIVKGNLNFTAPPNRTVDSKLSMQKKKSILRLIFVQFNRLMQKRRPVPRISNLEN